MLASVVSSDGEAEGIEYWIFLLNKSDDAFVAEPMTVAVSDLAGGPTPLQWRSMRLTRLAEATCL